MKFDQKDIQRATEALAQHGSVSAAARALRIPRKTLEGRIRAAGSQPGPVTPVEPAELRVLNRKIRSQADVIQSLQAQLKAEDRQAGIVLELAELLPQYVTPLDFPPELLVNPDDLYEKAVDAFEVDAVVHLSDQHSDRVIKSQGTWGLEQYDFNSYRARLWEWAKMIGRYCSVHLPRFRFRTLYVLHLGDAVNGDIHNMKYRNFFANSFKAALATGDAQAEAFAYLSQFFQQIVVVCVPGNHGRTSIKVDWDSPHDNLDYLVAKTMQLRVAGTALEEKVTIHAPEAWSAHLDIRGHLWHLNHGHGVVGTWGIPWYGFERREGRVQRLVGFKDQRVEYFAYGHFHTPMTRPAGQGKAFHAGAWYMTDGYSLGQLSVGNTPEQSLIVHSERFGAQMTIPLFVRDQEREQQMRAGEWESPFGRSLVIDEPLEKSTAIGQLPVITSAKGNA